MSNKNRVYRKNQSEGDKPVPFRDWSDRTNKPITNTLRFCLTYSINHILCVTHSRTQVLLSFLSVNIVLTEFRGILHLGQGTVLRVSPIWKSYLFSVWNNQIIAVVIFIKLGNTWIKHIFLQPEFWNRLLIIYL